MKDNGYHTALKKKLLQPKKRKVGDAERVPVKGIDAHKVATRILEEMEE